jgi:regulator of protease activity HflC (stomatin/prohibitin superfamily)
MPGTFIFAIIAAVFTAAFAAAWRIAARKASRLTAEDIASARRRDAYTAADVRPLLKGCTAGFAALAALLVLISSYNPVSTQNIGIVTSFGKPVSHLGAGLNFTAPWQSVTEMDEAIQVTDFDAASCQIQLRLADAQTACAKVAVRWRINPAAADALFRNYHNSTAGVENGLLIPELQNVANQVFASYDPVALLDSTAPVGSAANPTVPQLAQQVQAALTAKIGSEVDVISLFMPNIAYNATVQARLNAVLSQKANTLVAQQSEQTALAQAAANKDISASVSNDPGVLESRCLDILSEMVKAGQSVPAGFSCLGGSNVTGVIANSPSK